MGGQGANAAAKPELVHEMPERTAEARGIRYTVPRTQTCDSTGALHHFELAADGFDSVNVLTQPRPAVNTSCVPVSAPTGALRHFVLAADDFDSVKMLTQRRPDLNTSCVPVSLGDRPGHQARHPDEFVVRLLGFAPAAVTAAAKHQRHGLRTRPGTRRNSSRQWSSTGLFGRLPFFAGSPSKYEP